MFAGFICALILRVFNFELWEDAEKSNENYISGAGVAGKQACFLNNWVRSVSREKVIDNKNHDALSFS